MQGPRLRAEAAFLAKTDVFRLVADTGAQDADVAGALDEADRSGFGLSQAGAGAMISVSGD